MLRPASFGLFPVEDKKASTIVDAMHSICTMISWPRHITADRGSEFTAKLTRAYADKCKMKLRFVAPDVLQSNIVENFARFLQQRVVTMSEKEWKNWNPVLQDFVFSWRIRPNPNQNPSPYVLLYGQDPRFPFRAAFPRNFSGRSPTGCSRNSR